MNTSVLKKPSTKVTKTKSPKAELTLKELVKKLFDDVEDDEEEDGWGYNDSYHDPNYCDHAGNSYCCGITDVGELSHCSPRDQVRDLILAFTDNRPSELLEQSKNQSFQVMISDTVDQEKKMWAATKKHAFKGPITNNPNSDNNIRMYIVTKDMLPKIYAEKR